MPSRDFHAEWGSLARGSALLRIVGIVLVAMAIGATAGVCVVVSLVAASGTDTSIGSRHSLIAAPIVARPPPASAEPDMSFPGSEGRSPQPAPADLSGSQKSSPAFAAVEETHVEAGAFPAVAVLKPMHVETGGLLERPRRKKLGAKPKRQPAKHLWRHDSARERLGLMERLKPQ